MKNRAAYWQKHIDEWKETSITHWEASEVITFNGKGLLKNNCNYSACSSNGLSRAV